MEMFTSFFEQLLKMSVTASVVILAVLLARLCLRRLPKKYSYLLWIVVLFRLICPVSVSSEFSIFNLLGNIESEYVLGDENKVMLPTEEITVVLIDEATAAGESPGEYEVTTHHYAPNEVPVEANASMWLQIGTVLWLLGIGVILFYIIGNFS